MSELNRILYVEDEPDIQAVAQIALEAVGGFKPASFLRVQRAGSRWILAPPAWWLSIRWKSRTTVSTLLF